MVILFCGASRTKDMTRTKNRKESILKNAKSMSKMACLIADVGTKSANRGSTTLPLTFFNGIALIKSFVHSFKSILNFSNNAPLCRSFFTSPIEDMNFPLVLQKYWIFAEFEARFISCFILGFIQTFNLTK